MALECDIIVVCHDGRHESNPCDVVAQFGTDRCIIALTRSMFSSCNVFWVFDYFRTGTHIDMSVVPVVHVHDSPTELISAILSHPRACKVDSVARGARV